MFKIGIDIQKAKKEGNVLKIEGIASSPVIDLDGERFSKEAVEMMMADVIKGNIPIRVEHENKFYSDIGIWKSAEIVDGDKLFVKGEIDLELSMARDLEVLLRKGKKICMSVGGKVMDAVTEFVKEANKYVTTYKDIKLFEISIVKNPANQETSLAIAKSFNAETMEETEVAKTLSESAAELIKMPDIKEAIVAKSVNEVFSTMKSIVQKDWGDTEMPSETVEAYQLTEADLKYIAMFIQAAEAFKDVEYTWEDRDAIYTEIYEAEKDSGLPDECYVLDLLPWRVFPHHNADYTLNTKWLELHLWLLLSGHTYLSPKEFKLALSHLWRHWMMDSVSEVAKKSAPKENILEKQMSEADVTAIFKACYEYKVLKTGTRPQVEGNDLSDKEISKMANAFKAINERVRSSQTTASIAKNFYSLTSSNMLIEKASKTPVTETSEAAAPEATPVEVAAETTPVVEAPVVEAPVEAVPAATEAPVTTHGVGVTEKTETTTDGAEEVTKTEEAGTDASLNNTGSEEGAVVTEEAPAATEEAPAAEVTEEAPEVTKTEEAPAEAPVAETPATEEAPAAGEATVEPAPETQEADVVAKAKALVDSAVAEAIAPLVTAIEAIKTAIEEKDTVTKSQNDTISKNLEAYHADAETIAKAVATLAGSFELVKGQVSAMNTSIAFRKSNAFVAKRAEDTQVSETEDLSSQEGITKAIIAEMDANGGMYAKARDTVLARQASLTQKN